MSRLNFAMGENATFPIARNVMPKLEAVIHGLKPATPATARISAMPLAGRRVDEYPLS
jgi:hypothetical protein